MHRTILSILIISVLLMVSPVMAIVTNDTATSETAPSNYSSYNLSSLDWGGVYQYGTGIGKSMTAVDRYWLVTSRHYTLNVGGTFTNNGVTYTITQVVNHSAAADPNHSYDADLTLICVDKALPTYYDVYTGSISTSGQKTLVAMIGTGHAAGTVSTSTYTWSDGTTRKRRWGTNRTDFAYSDYDMGTYTEDILGAYFTLGNTTYEAGAADHDSGGGWLVYNTTSGKWELTGLNVAVMGTTGAYTGSIAVDLRDYSEWINGVVPEPATVTLLAAGCVALLRRRRK